jgi:hypothetical protein
MGLHMPLTRWGINLQNELELCCATLSELCLLAVAVLQAGLGDASSTL